MAAETRTEVISLSDIKDRSSIDFNFIENGVPLSGYESSDGPPICTVQSVSDVGVSIEVTTFFEGRLCQTPFRIVKDVKALAQIVANLGQGESGPMKFITISENDTSADYLEEKLLDGLGVELIKTTDSTGGTDENITVNVRRKNSIVIDSDQLQLDNDELSPGMNQYYGTNASGDRGWISYIDQDKRLAVSENDADTDYLNVKLIDGDGLLATINTSSNGSEEFEFSVITKNSIVIDSDEVQLVNDVATPGAFKNYGTDLAGVKGWFDASLILVSDTDEVPSYLESKITDGNGIATTISEDSTGSEVLDFSVVTKNSLIIDSDELQLVNDTLAPGIFKRYGSNDAGTKGWFDASLLRVSPTDAIENYLENKVVSGNVTIPYKLDDSTGEEFLYIDVSTSNSVVIDSDAIQLTNDTDAPGNSKFYGTSTSGVKGWVSLPITNSIVQLGNQLQLYQDQPDPGTNKYYGTNNDGNKGFHTLPALVDGALYVQGSLDLQIDQDSSGDYLYTIAFRNDEEIIPSYQYYGTAENEIRAWQSLSNLPNTIALGGLLDEDSTGVVDYPVMRRCTVHPSTGVITNIGTGGTDIALSSNGINADQQIIAAKVWNSVWNDIADFQDLGDKLRYGKCYYDSPNEARICTERCQKGVIGVASDTFGYALGVGSNKVPIAISGWVLAYVDKEYERGTALTNDKLGNLTEMTLKEKQTYPERIVAIYKKKELLVEWGSEDSTIMVNGRHWVKVKG
jgi:hypothetical protein